MLLRRHILIDGLIAVELVLLLCMFRIALYEPGADRIVVENVSLPPPTFVSNEASISAPLEESAMVNASLDYSGVIGGYEVARGWVFVKDQETRDQKVYVQVEMADGEALHFAATSTVRPDVGAAFKTSLYDVAGFEAWIPLRDGMDADVGPLRLVVTKQSGTYKSGPLRAGIRCSARVEITPPGSECRTAKAFLEANEDWKKSGYRRLAGWVYAEGQDTRGQEVYVQVEMPDGRVLHYTTTRVERRDVAHARKSALYESSGFEALIPPPDGVDVDVATLRVVVKNAIGMYKSAVLKGGVPLSSAVSVTPPTAESQFVRFSLDTNENRQKGMCHLVAGWVYVGGQETRGQEVYIGLERADGKVVWYTADRVERPDVVNAFRNKLYSASGFQALIPLADGDDIDSCTLRLVVRNKNGMYKSARVRTK